MSELLPPPPARLARPIPTPEHNVQGWYLDCLRAARCHPYGVNEGLHQGLVWCQVAITDRYGDSWATLHSLLWAALWALDIHRPQLHVHEPGNGTRYLLALVRLKPSLSAPRYLLALTNFGRAVVLHGIPGDPSYLMEKLGTTWADAQVVYQWLTDNWTRLTDQE